MEVAKAYHSPILKLMMPAIAKTLVYLWRLPKPLYEQQELADPALYYCILRDAMAQERLLVAAEIGHEVYALEWCLPKGMVLQVHAQNA